ncbi:MAG: UvrD-helicase domain-containing protein [Bacteroidetes bacterium]|nr:UvrD-helicase domain-containing protein [Bacteroidota bacterium]
MENLEYAPFLNDLDTSQKEAVMSLEGPLMVLAGAGSGKTRVLTYRIALLMFYGVDPFNILALTFTNKASKEMRERIERLVGPEAKNLWMGTFHSVFAKILRAEAPKIGYQPNFTIFDSDDSKSMVKSIIKEMNLDDKLYKPSVIYNRISSAKNNLITAEEYLASSELSIQDEANGRPKTADIFLEYSKRCYKSNVMDFDDLLINTYKLLKEHPDVLNKYQHQFRYVLVDEYQDTNHCQYMIIKKLVAVSRNICVVGDDSQSIYSFRGANIQNILNFANDYPEYKVVKLEQNYRSTKTIVAASGDIINHNKQKLDKTIWTSNPEGDKINVIKALTDKEEGTLVSQQIYSLTNLQGLRNEEVAILYRTNAQSRAFEEALRKINIPYKIYGGLSFYQRKEIKDLIAYLRLTVNQKDEEALKRIINYPARGIGDTTIQKVAYIANQYKVTLWDVLEKAHHFDVFGSALSKLQNFYMMICNFRDTAKTKDAYDTVEYVAKQSGILKHLHEDKTPEGISRYDNIMEMLNGVKEFCEDDTNEVDKTLDAYLQDVALLTDADKEDESEHEKVKLMTIHASKGLEFPAVFVVGLEENLFPSFMTLQSRAELEEERRLFYVAVTRAEKHLFLSYATSRFRYGNLLYCEPSRFLTEIEPKYLNTTAMFKGKTLPSKDSVFGKNEVQEKTTSRFSINPAYRSQFDTPKPPASDPNFIADDLSNLKEGCRVVHQRFGKGIVESVSRDGINSKAVINFEEGGSKTLILKFAKMKILA